MNYLHKQEDCGGRRERLDDYLSGELCAVAFAEVHHHLAACLPCAGEVAELRRLRRMLRRAVRAESAPPGLVRAIGRAVGRA